jgi:hypothetical protein
MRRARLNTLARHAAVACAVLVAAGLTALAQNQPPLITRQHSGELTYAADARGNRVPDFSSCGYAGGSRPIPDAPVRIVVSPVLGDSTGRIQLAIDHVSSLTPDANGLRGTVLLLRGRHEICGQLRLTHSGVILRGQGMGEHGTILVAAGIDRRTLIRVVGRHDRQDMGHATMVITDEYVPVGATCS